MAEVDIASQSVNNQRTQGTLHVVSGHDQTSICDQVGVRMCWVDGFSKPWTFTQEPGVCWNMKVEPNHDVFSEPHNVLLLTSLLWLWRPGMSTADAGGYLACKI